MWADTRRLERMLYVTQQFKKKYKKKKKERSQIQPTSRHANRKVLTVYMGANDFALWPVPVRRVSHTGDGSQNTNDSQNPGCLTAHPGRPHRFSLVHPESVYFKMARLWSASLQAASM